MTLPAYVLAGVILLILLRWLIARPAAPRPADSFYRSPAWVAVRNACRSENRQWFGASVCERCLGHASRWLWRKRTAFEVDHRKSRKLRPDLELDPGNAQTYCKPCNRRKGARNGPNWKLYNRWPVLRPLRWWHRVIGSP